MISIIIPIYKGKKYIEKLAADIQRCELKCGQEIEVIFVNDFPDDDILCPDVDNMYLINNSVNLGIHGARIQGLLKAKGEFILFMDQDDIIYPDYFSSQLREIKDADAVVCNLIHDNRKYYDNQQIMKDKITIDIMSASENYIVTPGQVLLRRCSIPDFWIEHMLTNNGADDWFLWISMLASGCIFNMNDEVLFEHTVHSYNTSRKATSMYYSIDEAATIIETNSNMNEHIRSGVRVFANRYRDLYIGERDYYFDMLSLMGKWMHLELQGKSIANKLIHNGVTEVYIYGKGMLGELLAESFQASGIRVEAYIDRKGPDKSCPNILLPDQLKDIQCPIVISLIGDKAKSVVADLSAELDVDIYCIDKMVKEVNDN